MESYVVVRLWIPISPRKAEVYQIDCVGLGTATDAEILWLYVTVDERLRMHVLYPFNHLFTKDEERFEREAVTFLVLQDVF